MSVTVLSPVEGLQPGEKYTGPNEKFLVENGYAKWNGSRKFDIDKPTGIDYKHPEVAEPAAFGPSPTTAHNVPAPADETLVQVSRAAAPALPGPAVPTEVTGAPTPAPETLL